MTSRISPDELRAAFGQLVAGGQLGDMTGDLLRPMVRDWLHENMADIMLQRITARQRAIAAQSRRAREPDQT